MEHVLGTDLDELAGYPPLSELGRGQRDELRAVTAAAGCFEDLPGKWQAALLAADATRHGAPAANGHCCGHDET